MAKIRILVTDRLELFRKSLILLLKEDNQIEVVDEASNGKELMEKLKYKLVDIVLMDYEKGDLACFATIDTIKNRFPEMKILVSGLSGSENAMAELMTKGANSFICKNCSPNSLFNAIHSVSKNGFYFDDAVSKALLNGIINEKNRVISDDQPVFKQRELDVLRGICDGLSNKEIAELLSISASTVDFYRTSIYTKTKCHNVANLMKYVIRTGVVQLN